MASFDLVFEGGGAKGIAFVGALEILQQNNHSWRRLVGTSAGAITATLCAAGYTISSSPVLVCLPPVDTIKDLIEFLNFGF